MNTITPNASTVSFERRLFEIRREMADIENNPSEKVLVKELRYDLRGYQERLVNKEEALRFYLSMAILLERLIETTNYWSTVARTMYRNEAAVLQA